MDVDIQKTIDDILKNPSGIWKKEIKKLYDIKLFYNRFYVYVNQVFGAPNLREDILKKIFGLPKNAVLIKTGSDDRGGIWQHHVAVNLKTKKEICSTFDLKQQDIKTEDTVCQCYSLYNTLIANRERILKNKKVSDKTKDFIKYLEPLENIIDIKRYLPRKSVFNPERINAVRRNTHKLTELFIWITDNGTKIIEGFYWLRNPEDPDDPDRLLQEGNTIDVNISDPIKKIKQTLSEWDEYGYIYFL